MRSFLNLFLQSNCPLCQRSTGRVVCQYCEGQLKRCQLPNPERLWQGNLPALAWGQYRGVLKRAIGSLKYDNQPQLAQPLGEWLAEAWLNSTAATTTQLIVVPIPLHPTKRQQRGYNQAELIGKSFCRFTRLPLKQALQRVRETEAQFSLSPTQRQQNLLNAFELNPGFKPQTRTIQVLLIDDIYTTGATAKAATSALHKHNIPVYGIVAVAIP